MLSICSLRIFQIAYAKRYGDGNTRYVIAVRKGRKELAVQTIYKTKSGGAYRAIENKDLKHTPKTSPPREDKNNKALEKNKQSGSQLRFTSNSFFEDTYNSFRK